MVRLHQPPGVGPARALVERDVAYRMTPERWKLEGADLLRRRRPGLGELPCNSPDLDHGKPGRVRQDDCHLQDYLELVANGVCGEVVEPLCAVARLEHEGLATSDAREVGLQRTRLAGEHQRRQFGDLRQSRLQVR